MAQKGLMSSKFFLENIGYLSRLSKWKCIVKAKLSCIAKLQIQWMKMYTLVMSLLIQLVLLTSHLSFYGIVSQGIFRPFQPELLWLGLEGLLGWR